MVNYRELIDRHHNLQEAADHDEATAKQFLANAVKVWAISEISLF